MRVLDSIREMLNRKSSVQMVADDPQLTAEMLLLLRTMFADGALSEGELTFFKLLCKSVFGIPEEDVPEVIRFLKDFSYETTGEQAASMFLDLPEARKKEIMVHLISMARADSFLHENEIELIERVAGVLGYTPEELNAWI